MRKFIENIKTFIIAIAGLTGGIYWYIKSGYDTEPLILVGLSGIEIVFFIIMRLFGRDSVNDSDGAEFKQEVVNIEKVKKQVNLRDNHGEINL